MWICYWCCCGLRDSGRRGVFGRPFPSALRPHSAHFCVRWRTTTQKRYGNRKEAWMSERAHSNRRWCRAASTQRSHGRADLGEALEERKNWRACSCSSWHKICTSARVLQATFALPSRIPPASYGRAHLSTPLCRKRGPQNEEKRHQSSKGAGAGVDPLPR